MNSAPGIKFPIKVDIALPAHKRSIILQAELGGVESPADNGSQKLRSQFHMDRGIIFANVHRIIRCIVDCQIHLQDGHAVRHALELGRSLGAGVWENSPLQMKQVPNIGNVAVRKLVVAGICSLEDLAVTEPSRLNHLLSRKPGFGEKVESFLKNFPKPMVSVRAAGKVSYHHAAVTHRAKEAQDIKPGRLPIIRFKAELGFMNNQTPERLGNKPVYVCFLAERSDGYLVDFRRMA